MTTVLWQEEGFLEPISLKNEINNGSLHASLSRSKFPKPAVVRHTYKPRAQEIESGGLRDRSVKDTEERSGLTKSQNQN